MYVATLDILTDKGGFNPQAARAIGEAIDLEIARSRAATATREDLSEFRRALSEEIGAPGVETEKNISALRTELGGVRAELNGDIGKLRAELKEDIGNLRAELKNDIGGLRVELKEDIGNLRVELKNDIGGLRAELKDDINKLRTEQKGDKADLVRWVFVVIMGQSAMLLGILYFFIRYFK
jgi:hypothetical protein